MIGVLGVMATMAVVTSPPAGTDPTIHVSARIQARSGADLRCLREAVTGFLAREGVVVDWRDAGSPAVAGAAEQRLSVAIDLNETGRAVLTFVDSASGSKRSRDVPLENGLDQIGCESLADVVASSVLAMISAAPIVPEPPVTSPPAAPPPVADTVRPDAAFDGHRHVLTVAYTLEPVASDALESGVEVGFGFAPMPSRHRQWLKVWYRMPVTIDAGTASVRWSSVAAAWAVSLSSRGRRAWFEAASHFGVSVDFLEERFSAAGTTPTSNRQTQVGPLVASEVTAGFRVARNLALYATLRFSLFAGREVSLSQNGVDLFDSWSLFRPGLVFGARWQ